MDKEIVKEEDDEDDAWSGAPVFATEPPAYDPTASATSEYLSTSIASQCHSNNRLTSGIVKNGQLPVV